MAAKRDIEITKGDDYAHLLTFVDEDRVPINLTGYTARAYIRKTASTVSAADAAFGVVITPLTGEVLLTLTDTQTTALVVLKCGYVWDLELTTGGGQTLTPVGGRAILVQDVTHNAGP